MPSPLPSPKEILKKYPLSKKNKIFIKNARELSKKIYDKKENKKILFVGPCSIHREEETIFYAKNLKEISKNLKNLFIIMRFFFEKPRSSIGWKGFLHDPFLKNSPNIKEGIIKTRSLMLKLTDMEIPIASEILDPLTINYFKDLITWGFIGSRTSSSQIHRQIASSLTFPIGLKNPIDGNVKTAVNSLISAKSPHSYLNISKTGKIFSFNSLGNPYSHIVLRGSYKTTNCDISSIKSFFEKMKKKKIFSPIVIDCAHDNSKKLVETQKNCFRKVLIRVFRNKDIIGIMMESYIKPGKQKINFKTPINPKISITDPCIGLEDTKKLILLAEKSLF